LRKIIVVIMLRTNNPPPNANALHPQGQPNSSVRRKRKKITSIARNPANRVNVDTSNKARLKTCNPASFDSRPRSRILNSKYSISEASHLCNDWPTEILGRGAVFTVQLPLIASARDVGAERLVEESFSPTTDIMPNTRLQGVTVLAVDDNADARDLLQTILERSGAVASVVGSGREALNVLRRLQPDVLLIDLAMPDMSGIELLNKIRALAPESGGITPAIALSAYGRNEDRAGSLRAGFDRYFAKPFNPNEVISVIVP
jgi:CheY-like chemotaxis protein